MVPSQVALLVVSPSIIDNRAEEFLRFIIYASIWHQLQEVPKVEVTGAKVNRGVRAEDTMHILFLWF